MNLPNADLAIVEEEKICEYLLNEDHPHGASKAKYFRQFGFTVENWQAFAVALQDHDRENEVARKKETGFGPRFEVDGEIVAPDGRRPRIRTVWQVDAGEVAPRLITAHPLEANS